MRTPVIVPIAFICCTLAPLTAPDAALAASVGPLKITAKLGLKKQIFGTVGVTSPAKSVKVANKGPDPVAILGVDVQGDFAVDPAASTCGTSIAPGEKCVLAVTFTPTGLGLRLGQLTITHSAAGSPQTVLLKGKSVVGKLEVAPKSLKFPDQRVGASSALQTLVVHNPNTVPLPITAVVSNSDEFAIASRTCGTIVPAGGDCTVDVRFTPSAVGGRKGKLRIAALAKGSPKNVTVKGKGLTETCGGATEDVLSDPQNCGGCGNVCPTSCVQGRCAGATVACGIGTPNLCSCGLDTTCTDFLDDPTNCGGCGNVCFVGQTCQHGACTGCTSAGAPDQCGAVCTSLQADPFNCGGCGIACPTGLCVLGKCSSCTENAPHECGGACTNLTTDEANCGGCGNVCPGGVTCQNGQCAGIACAAGTPDQCGNRCTNLETDSANCGACGQVCAGACAQGSCVVCGGATPDLCGASCTDISTDADNCGGCGSTCPAASICSGGTCTTPACAPIAALDATPLARVSATSTTDGPPGARAVDCAAKTKCGNECVDLQTNQFNCGECGKTCANACIQGQCLVCEGATPNVCGTACTDFLTSTKNCGGCGPDYACKSGEFCLRGICQGAVLCNGTPTNTNISNQHCGECNHACGIGRQCVRGECERECPDSEEIRCNGVCVDPLSDKYCGSCDNDCAKQGLRCVVPTGIESEPKCSSCTEGAPDKCGTECTVLTLDRKNCGQCGKACDPGEQCLGSCQPCPEGAPDFCGEHCTNVRTDAQNCGTCGHFCGTGGTCFEGKCITCPASAPTFCSAVLTRTCTNLQTDPRNCGTCGHDCLGKETCVDGQCQACSAEHPCADCLGTPKPWPCGSSCVDIYTDKDNCGGCGNVCPSGVCKDQQCDPGFCGRFEVDAWSGGISESSSANCGGAATLALDTAVHSTLRAIPSATVAGGCDVGGSVLLAQGGAICGIWGGIWTCGGTVSASGAMTLGCNCFTPMPATGQYAGGGYSGTWSFFASGTDNGDTVTDSAAGSFSMTRVP